MGDSQAPVDIQDAENNYESDNAFEFAAPDLGSSSATMDLVSTPDVQLSNKDLRQRMELHSDRPYANEEVKKRLCAETGLSVAKVSAWLQNVCFTPDPSTVLSCSIMLFRVVAIFSPLPKRHRRRRRLRWAILKHLSISKIEATTNPTPPSRWLRLT